MKKGQSLFEVVVALGMMALLIIGLIGVSNASVRNGTFSSNSSNATNFAQDGSNWLQSESNNDWNTFIGHIRSSANYCLDNDPPDWSHANTCTTAQIIGGTGFTRQVTFTCFIINGASQTSSACSNAGVNAVQAIVTVSWKDGQGTHSIKVTNLLTNWNT